MNFKTKVITLSSVLAALVLLYVGALIFSPASVAARRASKPVVPGLDAQSVARIELFAGNDTANPTVLHKDSGGTWQVEVNGTAYPARGGRITGFLDIIKGLQHDREVTSNADLFKQFNLTDTGANHLVLKDAAGKDVANVLVGKQAEQGGVYVRRAGQNQVYLSQGNLPFYFQQNSAYWEDLKLFPDSVTSDSVQRIAYSGSVDLGQGDGKIQVDYTVYRDQDENGNEIWVLASDLTHKLDQDLVTGVAASLGRIEAQQYASADAGSTGLDNPQLTMTIMTSEGKRYRLLVGNHADQKDRFYVKVTGEGVQTDSNGTPYTYLISNYWLGRVIKTVSKLEPPPESGNSQSQ